MSMALIDYENGISAPQLLKKSREIFNGIEDYSANRKDFHLSDILMSALAMFSLKYASLLEFDKDSRGLDNPIIKHNLNSLYGVEKAPSDSYMREVIDNITPSHIKSIYPAIHAMLSDRNELDQYRYIEDYYLVAMDGTGKFSSGSIHCDECCVKNHSNGKKSYYHQLMVAVMVHPDQKVVLPLGLEAITKQDGSSKNDCERNASKRLLEQLRNDYVGMKMIIVEDSLSSNAPHIKLLNNLNMMFILGVKEGDHTELFKTVRDKMNIAETEEFDILDEDKSVHFYRFINQIPLNKGNNDLLVNFLEYSLTRKGEKEIIFSWVTNITLTKSNVKSIMKGGRARWKIENETFNTLKNQGYNLEHNYGHGKKHLATNFGILMVLAFLIDQIQQLCCPVFQNSLKSCHSKKSFWKKLCSVFDIVRMDGWFSVWESIRKREAKNYAKEFNST
jgi:Transposase DDE domain